jgi:ABC-type glycerol-3-phosphate transport system substrate-binding protein
MSRSGFSRRTFLQGSVGLTVANFVPGTTPFAHAATMEEQTIAAAKAVGKADVNGMIWSPYLVPMKPVIAEFTKETGIGIGAVQDISIFDAPQRAMAEALSRSPQFDFIHIDSNMIPSLASAGYLEPLDEYIKKAGFHLDAVSDYAKFMTYGGQTYGVPTDGNVHIQYTRKDLIDNPDNKKRFADKFGTELKVPETWEDNLRLQEFLMDPSKDLYGSGNLRNRANGVTWWYMIFYSAGGFPFDDDMKPTIDNPAGQYAVDLYLQDKKVNHPEAANWGTPQMIPRIAQGTRGQLSVLGRHVQDHREPEAIENRRAVLFQPRAGIEVHGQDGPPVDLVAARGDPRSTSTRRGRRKPLTWRCGSAREKTAFRSSRTRSMHSMTRGPRST